jgi:ribosomal 50S subunit-associated protein YjgA (DUF615 family)
MIPKDFRMSLKLSEMIDKYVKDHKILDKQLKKEFIPLITKYVEEKDEDAIRHLLEIVPDEHSFKMRLYQAIVEIRKKKQEETPHKEIETSYYFS